MKITEAHIDYILQFIEVSKQLGVFVIVAENDCLRGKDIDRQLVLIRNHKMDFPFTTLVIADLDMFTDRLQMAKGKPGFSVEAMISPRDPTQVHMLTMKATGVKVDYRCTNKNSKDVEEDRIPKALSEDFGATFKIALSPEAIAFISKSRNTMGAERITLVGNQNGVSCEMADTNNDIFSYVITPEVTPTDPKGGKTFVYRYAAKPLLAAFKVNSGKEILINKKGLMKMDVDGADMYILPTID